MQDLITQVVGLLRGAWRYRWLAVATAWLLAVAGWIGVQFVPDRYTASTQVYVDTESLLRPLLSGVAVNRDVMSQVGMMQAVMLSRPNLEKVAQTTDLMLDAPTRKQQEAVIDSLAKRIQLGRPSGPAMKNTFEVSFDGNNPNVAFRVVRTLLDTFMEDSLGFKRGDSGMAQRFLETQIAEYEKRLVEAEARLARFKQDNMSVLPLSSGGYLARLEAETVTLQQLRQTYMQTQTRRDELARQLAGEEPSFGLMGTPEGSPIDGQIARLKAQRVQVLLQYTEKHPQVQALNDAIARLEDEKRGGAEVSDSAAAPGAGLSEQEVMVRSLDMNPVYQNLRMAVSQADADLAAVRGQMQAQQALVSELRSQMAAIPEVEAELVRLNRDYEVNQKQYQTLVQRLESARISQSAEQDAENIKLRVLEPPTMPVKPSGPQRAILNSMVLLAALAAGIGLALLLAQLNPTFSSRELLHRATGVPVIGMMTVAMDPIPLPWYRRQPLLVGAALSLLLIVFALNLVMTETLRGALRTVAG